MLRTKEKV
jgi:hypothetical protein